MIAKMICKSFFHEFHDGRARTAISMSFAGVECGNSGTNVSTETKSISYSRHFSRLSVILRRYSKESSTTFLLQSE